MIKQRILQCFGLFVFTAATLFAAGTLSDGYILYGSFDGKTTALLDKSGTAVKTWTHASKNGYAVYLLENGNLLRTAQVAAGVKYPTGAMPVQGIIEEVDSSNKVLWTYQLADDTYITHHDMKPMPNGHIIACAFELKTKEEMIEAGVDTTLLKQGMGGGNGKSILAEMIFELDPHAAGGPKIVWEWHIWDHVVPKAQAAQHPELFSGSLGPSALGQWVHLNGIDFNPKTNLIVFTSRLFSEVYVIDHGTTTEQAASHTGGTHGKGGDLLYRWGRSCNYRPAGDTIVKTLHCCTWIPEGYPGAGNILFFHNNATPSSMMSVGNSQVIEVKPPLDASGKFISTPNAAFGPAKPTWIYAPAPPDSMFSGFMSSAFRLKNGNTLVHECQNNRVREVTPDGQTVWKYSFPLPSGGTTGGMMMSGPAKIMYYPSSHAGVAKLLGLPIGIDPQSSTKEMVAKRPAIIRRTTLSVELDNVAGMEIGVYTLQGRQVVWQRIFTSRAVVDMPTGTSLIKISDGHRSVSHLVTTVRQ